MTLSGHEFGEKSPKIFSQIINLQTAPWSVLKSAQRPYLVPVLNYWTWTKRTLQKLSSEQIFIKLRLWQFLCNRNPTVTKLWSHGHMYNMIWVTRSNFVDDVMGINYVIITFVFKVSEYLFLHEIKKYCFFT